MNVPNVILEQLFIAFNCFLAFKVILFSLTLRLTNLNTLFFRLRYLIHLNPSLQNLTVLNSAMHGVHFHFFENLETLGLSLHIYVNLSIKWIYFGQVYSIIIFFISGCRKLHYGSSSWQFKQETRC